MKRGPREDGRWYWRADRPDGRGGRIDVWTGWATKDEAAAEVRRKLQAPDAPAATGEIRTVGDLLDCWLGSVQLERDEGDGTRTAIESGVQRLLRHGLAESFVEHLGRDALVRYARSQPPDDADRKRV